MMNESRPHLSLRGHIYNPQDTVLLLLLAGPLNITRISQQVLLASATPTPQSVLMAWRAAVISKHRGNECYCACYGDGGRIVQGTVICTDRGNAPECYCVCYEDGERIVQRTVICTDRGTANECYCVCYKDGERIVQGIVICTEIGTATERYCVCYEDGGRIVQGTVMCTDRGTAIERYCVCYEDEGMRVLGNWGLGFEHVSVHLAFVTDM
jgi:hypothetical protein